MPIYIAQCPKCSQRQEIFLRLSELDRMPAHCGEPMERVMCAPMVAADIPAYKSMVTGEYITSRSAHREHLKRHGLIEVGNETKYLKPKPLTPPPGLKETIVRVANEKLR